MSFLEQLKAGYSIAKREMYLDTRMRSLRSVTQDGVTTSGVVERIVAEIETEKRLLQQPRTIAGEIGYAIGTYFDYR